MSGLKIHKSKEKKPVNKFSSNKAKLIIRTWDSVRNKRSISDLGNESSRMLDGPLEVPCWAAWWHGDGALDVTGLLISDGDNSTTGTLRKCSVGIRI